MSVMAEIKQGAQELGLQLSESAVGSLAKFMEEVLRVNRSLNLTRIPAEQFVSLHILDSLSLLNLECLRMIPSPVRLLDLGSGAGFPGLPLAVASSNLSVTLLDARQKRISFLTGAIELLGLRNVTAAHGRAEVLAHAVEYRQQFEFVVARALAEFPVLLELAAGFLKVGGTLLCLKGPEGDQELVGLDPRIAELGLLARGFEEFKIPASDRCHRVYLFEKIAPTPERYPRAPQRLGR